MVWNDEKEDNPKDYIGISDEYVPEASDFPKNSGKL